MARDYAQRGGGGGGNKRRPQTRHRSGLPAWVWLVFGLSVGLAIAAFVYISRPATPMPGTEDEAIAKAEPEAIAKKPAAKPAEKSPSKPRSNNKNSVPLPPEEEERFTFYKDLKKQRVPVIPRDERPPKPVPKPAPKATEELFLIQIASYRAVSDAENQRASLALLGIESRIEKVTVDDKDVYFRVRSGPVNRDKAQTLVTRLHDNGIEAIILKSN